ncbi:MAG: hypothetical protein VKJ64_05620 [Leptolyngbyaceae bacterium]|nr:hypothetical protein [Leptolyngbyaceae bacterium]
MKRKPSHYRSSFSLESYPDTGSVQVNPGTMSLAQQYHPPFFLRYFLHCRYC